jgi:hypothetical protein
MICRVNVGAGKMADEGKPEQLNITVKSQDGDQVQFKVKATTKFEKVLFPGILWLPNQAASLLSVHHMTFLTASSIAH